jgi:hypothetical protein
MVQLNLKKSELLGYFTFNSTYWDNDGPAKPFEKNKLLGYFLSTILLVRGIMMNHQTCSTRKANCWDTFYFQHLYLG